MNLDEARRLAKETLNIAPESEEWDYLEPLANALLEALKREDVYKDSLKKSAERRGEAETQWSQMRHRVAELEEALRHIQTVMHTQVAESQRGPGRSYNISSGGYSGIYNALVALSPKETKAEDGKVRSRDQEQALCDGINRKNRRIEELEGALQELVEAAHWVLTSKGVSFDSIGALMKARDRGRAALAKGEEE